MEWTHSDPTVHEEEDLDAAVEAVQTRIDESPDIALILGSGLGRLAEAATNTSVVPTTDIPAYPASTVEGHDGHLVFGQLADTSVVFVQGRVHLYEGYPVQEITMPVRLVHALGADRMVVTNSAGGINRTFRPGTLMFITDHLNMVGTSPGVGSVASALPGGSSTEREDQETPYYDGVWTDRAEEAALTLDVDVRRGTYAWALGPSYETRAEVQMLERLGADAVGMSTVPEVLQAQQLGMRVVGLSTITNRAAGIAAGELDHDEVLEVGERMRGALMDLVPAIVHGVEA